VRRPVLAYFLHLKLLFSLAFTYFFRERNPITTKFELIFLGMAGLLWLSEFSLLSRQFSLLMGFIVLGVYLATSDAQSADVECFSPQNSETPLDNELASCKYSGLLSQPSIP